VRGIREDDDGPRFHPSERVLKRFMRGNLPRLQAGAVIRHLLTGCPQCRQVTRRLWRLADRVPRKEFQMTEAEAAAQVQLRTVTEELAKIQTVLRGIAESLPPSPPDDEEPQEGAGALRSVIECVLADSLQPAIRDLQAAVLTLPSPHTP
jgi:hypothetical protein